VIVRQYFQPDAPDPILEAAYVTSLAGRHVDGARGVSGIDESGGEARVYFVDTARGSVVVKVQRPQQLRTWTSLEKEVVFLRHLAEADPSLPVPRVLGYGRDDSTSVGQVEYTVMTRMGGDAAVRRPIPDSVRSGTLRALGRVIRRIHRVPQEPLWASGLFMEEHTPHDLRQAVMRDLDSVAAAFQRREVAWPLPDPVDSLKEWAVARVPDEDLGVALHTNPGATHTFVDEDGGFVGLIDFGDAYIGAPVFDLARWVSPSDRQAVLAGYCESGPLSAAFRALYDIAEMEMDLAAQLRRSPDAPQALDHLQSLLHRGR
jgi:hygromycin-B 7''-O-kinase